MSVSVTRLVSRIVSPVVGVLHATGVCSTVFLLRGFESLRWRVGQTGAWREYRHARRTVPAYAAFLKREQHNAPALFTDIPSMDKANYITQFPLESRCVGGAFPTNGLLIDESSGSSGAPTNWVRGVRERNANRRTIQRGLQHRLGKDKLLFINAFALGPWATGVNLTLSLSTWARIKTLGPDLVKIGNALRAFGTDHHYVIMGYPPFLKQLADHPDIDWRQYHVSMVFGGEGMGESMRRYLQDKGIARVYGSYGASDLELNMAAETELTIAVRRLLEAHPEFAQTLLQHHGALPMIFQFNPAEFYFETNAEGELLVTLARPGYVAPKIRYNIHDLGHVVRVPALRAALAKAGLSLPELDAPALDLPLLFHYGRSDNSVSYFGCKIPPADVQETLFRLPDVAAGVDAFQLATFDDADGDKRLVLALELSEHALHSDTAAWSEQVFDTLATVNQDFRESRRMVPAGKEPSLELHAVGTGPFAGADIRIKRRYVVNRDAARA